MHQIRGSASWRERFTRSGYFFAAVLLHLIILLMIATIVIFHAPAPPAEAVFREVHVAVPPPPPAPPPPTGNTAATPAEPQREFVPPTAPMQVISNNDSTSFKVDTSKVMAQALTQLNLPAPQSSGLGQGAAGLNNGSGSSRANFFGVQTSGKHIAFLLDYSGSMEGKFRETMEKQLEKTLHSLPDGTQVILICWAGPAWLYNQTAPQIASKWKKIGDYDDFTTVPGATLDPPQWIQTDTTSTAEILKGIKAQISDPGGTDWRQPFRYALMANPPPDVIFFLTDGQIPPANVDRAMDAISVAINKADAAPQVNCLWIENKSEKSIWMEKLAQKYNGEFRKVSTKDAGP